jgi:hypothetical protein
VEGWDWQRGEVGWAVHRQLRREFGTMGKTHIRAPNVSYIVAGASATARLLRVDKPEAYPTGYAV